MLTDIDGNPVTDIPEEARRELEEVLSHTEPGQVDLMNQAINDWADAAGNEDTDFFASGWMTGNDWSEVAGGVFQPLYRASSAVVTAREFGDPFKLAGWMYGWLVRLIVITRQDEWVMYKNPEAGTDEVPRNFWSTFYWRRGRGRRD